MWKDCGDYYLSLNPQGTDEWLKERIGRITMSNMAYCTNHSYWKKDKDIAPIIRGDKKAEFSKEAIARMQLGTDNEPVARDLFAEDFNLEIIERGLAVPKYNLNIGASTDGDIVRCNDGNRELLEDGEEYSDGLIEIKCIQRLYDSLDRYEWLVEEGVKEVTGKYYHEHIKIEHYDQMQGCMAVLKKKFCFYIVYVIPEKAYYYYKVYFDKDYWNNELYPKSVKFIEKYLKDVDIVKPF